MLDRALAWSPLLYAGPLRSAYTGFKELLKPPITIVSGFFLQLVAAVYSWYVRRENRRDTTLICPLNIKRSRVYVERCWGKLRSKKYELTHTYGVPASNMAILGKFPLERWREKALKMFYWVLMLKFEHQCLAAGMVNYHPLCALYIDRQICFLFYSSPLRPSILGSSKIP
jgi:hypothetical protein